MVGKYAGVSFSNESRNEVPDFWIKEEPNDKWEKWEVSDVKYYGNFLSFTYILNNTVIIIIIGRCFSIIQMYSFIDNLLMIDSKGIRI